MSRAGFLPLLFLFAAGCVLPPEQVNGPERVPIRPLPENGPLPPFADLVERARAQATAATNAFYVNRWAEVEDAAIGLERTAGYLGKAKDAPVRLKDRVTVEAGDLGKEASKLREAAKTQGVQGATEALQRINLKVRELRADE
jgi:hypothetical protein